MTETGPSPRVQARRALKANRNVSESGIKLTNNDIERVLWSFFKKHPVEGLSGAALVAAVTSFAAGWWT